MRSLALAFALALAACGGSSSGPSSRAVGGPCTSGSDCDQKCIAANDTFPNGYCTLPCTRDSDCPSGAACVVDDFGNLCEVECSSVSSCTVFGPKFACDDKARVQDGSTAKVCRSH